MAEDDLIKAWESLKKKRGKEETEEKKEEEEEETEKELEEAIEPEEKTFSFASTLPEKAPSLEFSAQKQDLEETVGFERKEKKEEEKEKPDYFAKPSYGMKTEKEERKYTRPIISLSEFAEAPQLFKKVEFVESMREKVGMLMLHKGFEKEYISSEEVETKWLGHEKSDRVRKEEARKYKPIH